LSEGGPALLQELYQVIYWSKGNDKATPAALRRNSFRHRREGTIVLAKRLLWSFTASL
jgi:hypothetical protein